MACDACSPARFKDLKQMTAKWGIEGGQVMSYYLEMASLRLLHCNQPMDHTFHVEFCKVLYPLSIAGH